MQNLTVQKVCLFLITGAFFVAAPWLTSETLSGNTLPLLTLGAVAVLLLFVYCLGDRCWMIIPFCLSIDGNLNFLPLNFSMQELAIITVFSYLLLRTIFGLDVAWKLGPALLWMPLAGVLAVVLYHWISSGDIGIKLLGGGGWGGRKYFKVFISSLCVPLLASFPRMRWKDLQLVPLIYFLGSFVDIVPDTLSTFAPSTAPYIWRVYSGVNLTQYGASLQGNFLGETGVTRIGTLGRLGTAVGLVTLCYFPAYTWLQPSRLWALPTVLLGGLFCAVSGFRNMVVRYFFSLLAGLYASVRWRSFLILPVALMAAFGAALTQGKVFDYPLAMQRALSFLPGDWDIKAKGEADASSEWREKMKALFYREYFPKHPFLGVSYHFDPELAKVESDVYRAIAQRQKESGDDFADVRRFIEMRQPHEGPVHILLVAGMVGAAFFTAFSVCLLIYAFRNVTKTPPREITPIQVWTLALLTPQVIGFFLLFGDLTNFLIQVCPVIMLLYRFERLKANWAISPVMDLQGRDSPQGDSIAWRPTAAGFYQQRPPLS